MQKQYMVMKLARQIGSALNITPLAELLPWPIAEKLAAELRQADPESVYVIRGVSRVGRIVLRRNSGKRQLAL